MLCSMMEAAGIRAKNEIAVEDEAEGWSGPLELAKVPPPLDVRRRPCANRASGVRRRAP
jgi:hypothetical protein